MNTTQMINDIVSNVQPYMNRVCRVTMKNGEKKYIDQWDACAGIAVRLYFTDGDVIKVDHNTILDYISHIG